MKQRSDGLVSRLPADPHQRQLIDEFARRQNLLQEALTGRPPSPLPGDILAVPLARARPLFWTVLIERPEVKRYLVVPADTSPLLGSTDLAISAQALCGPLVLRLGARRWWPARCFADCERVGLLEDWHISRAQGALMQLLKGTLAVMPWQQETDLDPAYQGWMDGIGEIITAVELGWDHGAR